MSRNSWLSLSIARNFFSNARVSPEYIPCLERVLVPERCAGAFGSAVHSASPLAVHCRRLTGRPFPSLCSTTACFLEPFDIALECNDLDSLVSTWPTMACPPDSTLTCSTTTFLRVTAAVLV